MKRWCHSWTFFAWFIPYSTFLLVFILSRSNAMLRWVSKIKKHFKQRWRRRWCRHSRYCFFLLLCHQTRHCIATIHTIYVYNKMKRSLLQRKISLQNVVVGLSNRCRLYPSSFSHFAYSRMTNNVNYWAFLQQHCNFFYVSTWHVADATHFIWHLMVPLRFQLTTMYNAIEITTRKNTHTGPKKIVSLLFIPSTDTIIIIHNSKERNFII